MEVWVTFLIYTVALLAVSALGAYMPFIRKLDDKQTHLLVALSAGIFLGILFFLLLPEAFGEGGESGMSTRDISIVILIGFFAILLVDVIIKHFHMVSCPCECHEDDHKHELTSLSAFIGLSIHACVDGLVLATTLIADPNIGFVALGGMCLHKFVELFSLSSTFHLSDKSKKQIVIYLTAFALITPVAALFSFLVLGGVDVDGKVGIPMAFSAGTFMFVALCSMMPEAFHRKKQVLPSFIMVVIGIAIAAAVFLLFGHTH